MSYGFCPICGAKGKFRERRPDGNDICEKYCKYPSRDSLTKPKELTMNNLESITHEEAVELFAKEPDAIIARLTRALEEIAALQPADFNTEIEHWANGNHDDSFEYGCEVGQFGAANMARKALAAK